MNLKGKNILLLIPNFKKYENYIIKEIEKSGGNPFFVSENIDSRCFWYKFICILFPSFRYKVAEWIYTIRIKKMTSEPDYVLVIRGANLSVSYLQRLKAEFSHARFIMYQWDSATLNQNAEKIHKEFDKILTFDSKDAVKFHWKYRPLFFIEEFIGNTGKRKYDLSYITTLVPGRLPVYFKLKKECEKKGVKLFAYLATPLHSYIYHRYFLRDYNFLHALKDIHIRNLPIELTHKIYDRSKCIIDYTRPEQNGLTMRTIEAIGHKCKIITNNKNIIKEDFYNINNISLYEETEIRISPELFEKPYEEIESKIYMNYSLNQWLYDIFV